MQCSKCNATLSNEDLTNCPYCQALISSLLTDTDCDDEQELPVNKLMKLIVENYSPEIYLEPQRLSAIVADLFPTGSSSVDGQIKYDIREIINLGVTIQIYDIYDCDDIFNEDYIELVQSFLTQTAIDSKVVISLIDLLFFGLGIEFSVDESELIPVDMANEVLNSVLNKSSSDDDFASSVLDFIRGGTPE